MKSFKGQCYHIRRAASYEAYEKAGSPFLFSLNSTKIIVVPKNNVELLCYRVQIVYWFVYYFVNPQWKPYRFIRDGSLMALRNISWIQQWLLVTLLRNIILLPSSELHALVSYPEVGAVWGLHVLILMIRWLCSTLCPNVDFHSFRSLNHTIQVRNICLVQTPCETPWGFVLFCKHCKMSDSDLLQ